MTWQTLDLSGLDFERLWAVRPAPSDPSVVYLCAEPATVFRSDDGGATWRECVGLKQLPAYREFWGLAGDSAYAHSLVVDPHDPERVFVGITVAGVLLSEDGGQTWQPRNSGIAPFYPHDKPHDYADYHRDLHRLTAKGVYPNRLYLYATTHSGLYRSDDDGLNWRRLPTPPGYDVGRPLALYPHRRDSLWIVALERGDADWPRTGGRFSLLRSDTGGQTWLPQTPDAEIAPMSRSFYREAMVCDSFTPLGVFLGTSDGEILYTVDVAGHWSVLARVPGRVRALHIEILFNR